MSRDFSVSCLCAVKVAELWDRLTWLRGRSFVLFKDDVLDADPSRSRGFEGKCTFRRMASFSKPQQLWKSSAVVE